MNRYAGTQYGAECFCGNAYGTKGQAALTDCSMPCAGDANQKCGNGYLNIYNFFKILFIFYFVLVFYYFVIIIVF